MLKNNLKKTFKVLLLKVLYALKIQDAYNRKSLKVRRVKLCQTSGFIFCKILRYKIGLITIFVGAAF